MKLLTRPVYANKSALSDILNMYNLNQIFIQLGSQIRTMSGQMGNTAKRT